MYWVVIQKYAQKITDLRYICYWTWTPFNNIHTLIIMT